MHSDRKINCFFNFTMLSVIENLINLILIKHLAFNLLPHLLLAGGWKKLIGHLKSYVSDASTGVSKALTTPAKRTRHVCPSTHLIEDASPSFFFLKEK